MPGSRTPEGSDKGFTAIRRTFYGVGEEHDRLAGMVLTVENVSRYEETKAVVEEPGTPCTEVGWMLPLW